MSDETATTSAAPLSRAAAGRAPSHDDDKPVVVALDRAALARAGVDTTRCPQCGVNPAGEPRAWTFRWARPGLTVAWFAASWLSLVVVSPILAVGGLAGAYFARRSVRVKLPLCDDCYREARRAKKIRGYTVLSGFMSPVIAGLLLVALNDSGLLTSPTVRAVLMGVMTVAGLAGAVFGHVKTSKAALFVKRITKKTLELKASPTWRRVLEQEQPGALEGAALPPARDDETTGDADERESRTS